MTQSNEATASLFGAFDTNIKIVENAFGVRVSNRNKDTDSGDAIVVTGESADVKAAVRVLEYLKRMIGDGETLSEQSIEYVISAVKDGQDEGLEDCSKDVVCITNRGKPIKAKTIGQKKYIKAIKSNTVVLGLGPAGTGKTFLAVAMAVEALRQKTVTRIILTRPAVEAGERLGFLPGDLQSKIDPYLRPLYDALFEMLGAENFQKYMERGTIEIAPLAYMRGRTLDDSFIILDEAQNTTIPQLKMFLTRMGMNTKMIITGDLTQIDLPSSVRSGLSHAMHLLRGIKGIGIVELNKKDIVRHKLVTRIVEAYEREKESLPPAPPKKG